MSGFVQPSPSVEKKILDAASDRPKMATLNYTGSRLDSITWTDGDGYTSHQRVLTYSGESLVDVTETFVFGGELWTLTKGLVYVSGKLATVTNN